jgi:hypothetical protein
VQNLHRLACGLAAALILSAPLRAKTTEEVVPMVNNYCGACHAVPRPDVQPKRAWPELIRIMVGIMQERTGKSNISEEHFNDIVAFYYGAAPEELPMLPYPEVPLAGKGFVARDIGAMSKLPFVTNINVVKLTGKADVELLACDGETRELKLLASKRGKWKETALAQVDVPVHTQVLDIDGDKDMDVLLADLGQLPPVKDLDGKLWLLRQTSPGKFSKELLLDKIGRTSDAEAVDLDGDGDLDIAVAVFGGHDVGEVIWLENGGQAAVSQYTRHTLFGASGAINATPVDLNGDGRMDLVSLIAQEHEAIVVFFNKGGGEFQANTVARAPHPMYGSTSMTPEDLDKDGDIDIVFTNGDAFDAQTDPKPYHGVQWLENMGDLKFRFHDIGRLYGASTAAVGDLDNDGDLDVVAGSWVSFWNDPKRFAVVWYENDGKQNFTAHGLATRPAGLASIKLVDVNGDGALDIVAGAIRMDLLLTKMGSPYLAARHFPPADGKPLSRILVLENPGLGKR